MLRRAIERNFMTAEGNSEHRESVEINPSSHAFNSDSDDDNLLERLVFGDGDDVLDNIDRVQNDRVQSSKKRHSSDCNEKKSVWDDEDDKVKPQEVTENLKSKTTFKEQLEKRFLGTWGAPSWAELEPSKKRKKSNSDDEEDDELGGHRADDYLQTKSSILPKGLLDFGQCKDVNYDSDKQQISVKSVEFHPTSQVGLVASKQGSVSIFQIDGKKNSHIQTVFFERFPIETAHFSVDGEHIVVGSSMYGHLHYYDMIAGKIIKVPWNKNKSYRRFGRFELSPDGKYVALLGQSGFINLIGTKSRESVFDLKMNGEVSSVAFADGGSTLYTHGDSGEVYVWDMDSRECVQRFFDDGCVKGTAIAASPNSRFLACGQESGIVNLYDTESILQAGVPNPLPVRTITNLTTGVTGLKFNSSSEILAMSSSHKENGVKLYHVNGGSVFSNFPKAQLNYKHVQTFDFSPHGGYFAMGNNKGRTQMLRLKHYSAY